MVVLLVMTATSWSGLATWGRWWRCFNRSWRRKRWLRRFKWNWASSNGPTDARGQGKLAGVICVAGGGSTAAAASGGAKWRRWQKQRSKTAHGELGIFIGTATVTVTGRRATSRWQSWRAREGPGRRPAARRCPCVRCPAIIGRLL
jgi:hypothetical protein